jgi:hypothetical protein
MCTKGKDLGGIHTVEDLKERCDVDEFNDCWHYKGATFNGAPVVNIYHEGKRRALRGRRAALILAGVKIKPGYEAYARECCKSDDCVNPDHSKQGSRAESRKALAKSGRLKGQPKTIAARKKTAEANRKLTQEQVQEIKSSPESNVEISNRMGIHRRTIWSIRNGYSWKDHAYSVFNWRP